jgi:hypothetical protein
VSNHLAIATVTAAFGETIQEALNRDVAGAKVHIGRPDGTLGQNGQTAVSLFLYQVRPNGALRNSHLPYRGAGPGVISKPMVALDLHYLLSFYGDSTTFEPERMLGATVRALEERPLLQRSVIEKVIQDNPQELGDSDLHEAASLVRAQPSSLNLEEMSKLWSVFFQVPYVLSVAYECSSVMVEADTSARQPLPVTRPSIAVFTMGGPRIDAVEAIEGAGHPILWGGTVRLTGQRLTMTDLSLRLGDTDVTMSETTQRDGTIELPLTAAAFGGVELRAGLHLVRAVLPAPAGAPSHLERTSDAAPMILRPSVSVAADAVTITSVDPGAPRDGTMTVSFSPAVVEGQEVRAFLDERVASSPASHVLEPQAPSSYPAAALTFAFSGVAAGDYLLRAHVDGVESAVSFVTDASAADYREISGPEVTIP